MFLTVGPVVGAPDEGQRIDLLVQQLRPVFGQALHGRFLADQAAVGVQQDARLLPAAGDARDVLVEDVLQALRRVP
jgi:hypothetical protein